MSTDSMCVSELHTHVQKRRPLPGRANRHALHAPEQPPATRGTRCRLTPRRRRRRSIAPALTKGGGVFYFSPTPPFRDKTGENFLFLGPTKIRLFPSTNACNRGGRSTFCIHREKRAALFLFAQNFKPGFFGSNHCMSGSPCWFSPHFFYHDILVLQHPDGTGRRSCHRTGQTRGNSDAHGRCRERKKLFASLSLPGRNSVTWPLMTPACARAHSARAHSWQNLLSPPPMFRPLFFSV